MKPEIKQQFMERWAQYFPGAELPLVLFYADEPGSAKRNQPEGWRCIICELARVRAGTSLRFDAESVSCGGGRRYLGFGDTGRCWQDKALPHRDRHPLGPGALPLGYEHVHVVAAVARFQQDAQEVAGQAAVWEILEKTKGEFHRTLL